MTIVDSAESASPILDAFRLVVVVAALMWLVEVVDQLACGGCLDSHGIVPRSLGGLTGVLWAPFLHAGFGHLAVNTVPFLLLGGLVALEGRRRWLVVTGFVVLAGGLATWVAARPLIHIGASGLVFGYAGFLLVAGVVERSLRALLAAFVVAALFGGMLLRGMLPGAGHVSWESHLFGFTAGVLAAFGMATSEAERHTAG
jgi:membrane associated rhomboid family serine protease